ncbi:hypothetical protein [Chitinophaga sp. ARDCPP14]|uniref:hypothetical protein n=1 Tax=Chitinophaga sp. ARDCPP14 TaxID=3391139 RepID=UPI003F52135E
MRTVNLILIVFILSNVSCQNTQQQPVQSIGKNNVIKKEKMYTMNIDAIKRHIEWQSHIESTEDGIPASYTYTEQDVNIALPIIAQGLKDKGFKQLSDSSFNKALTDIFGKILSRKNDGVRFHNKFNTIIEEGYEKEDEYDYTIENIFVSIEYKFISWVPLLGDFIEFEDNNSYKIDLHPKIISRNKYLFNNSQSDLAYLLAEDTLFLKTLVKSFGYTKEEKINTLAMNDYLDLDNNHMPTVGEIIFVKNAEGVLEIKQELLQWISDHTRVNDNALLRALEQYAYSLYSNTSNDIFANNPFETFSLDEKRKIVAYIANIYEPLQHQLMPKNPGIWPGSSVLENMLNEDKGLEDFLKQHRYFSLPALKQELEPAD